MTGMIITLVAVILIYIIIYRKQDGENVYKYFSKQASFIYEQYAPYSFKVVREKIKDLGQEYTPKEYAIQIAIFSISAAIISYLYF